ncbi:hypothetical protein A4R35_20510 [Thermogemmatispora tikiterensis]|uniref:Uncharacterized protein n=1 Tax=Thermogemmatispora tikiterensis TaxID=1825093 RepID=A0A328VQH1_9CHLR|nr:hypothetical protein A4R35_20510 [Thermogemmatispora tikiterensis]
MLLNWAGTGCSSAVLSVLPGSFFFLFLPADCVTAVSNLATGDTGVLAALQTSSPRLTWPASCSLA